MHTEGKVIDSREGSPYRMHARGRSLLPPRTDISLKRCVHTHTHTHTHTHKQPPVQVCFFLISAAATLFICKSEPRTDFLCGVPNRQTSLLFPITSFPLDTSHYFLKPKIERRAPAAAPQTSHTYCTTGCVQTPTPDRHLQMINQLVK